MAITYPLTFPSTPAPVSIRWSRTDPAVISTSPHTGQQIAVINAADLWWIDVEFEPLTRVEAAPLLAFFDSLNGSQGTFLFGDTLQKVPRGSPSGTIRVKGANQVSNTLAADGAPNSTMIFKAGDFFQIDNSLYRVRTDTTSDGSGNASIEVGPHLRNHADNAVLVYTNPKGLFRLANPPADEAGGDHLYYLSFTAMEAR